MRMLREVVVLAMFEDEDAVSLQQPFLEDDIGDGRQLLECVGWVGKDEVVLLSTGLQEAEDITTENAGIVRTVPLELQQTLLDEAVMVAVEFDADNTGTATREQFECDAACTCKEVEGLCTFEIDILHQYVEDVLLGKVGGRPRLERAWYVKMTSLVFSRYDSQNI